LKILDHPPEPAAPPGAAPKVSVLIPVFNGGTNLAECLDSVLAQDFRDVEILVADDGSSDDSMAIVATYAARDSRLRHWTNPQRLGLTANSNACLRAARGEYIKFIRMTNSFAIPASVKWSPRWISILPPPWSVRKCTSPAQNPAPSSFPTKPDFMMADG